MVQLWFREMIENTGADYEEQEKLYNQFRNKPKPNYEQPVAPINNSGTGSKVPDEGQNLIDSLVSFKSIDDLLEKNE